MEQTVAMGLKKFAVEFLPFAVMVMVECFDVGLSTLSKAAMTRGMSHYVFVFYSNALATFILLPLSFIFDRTKRPPLSFSLLCKFFLLSLIGITIMQNCVFTGISYSSPTLASAMSNLIPAFTFVLAVIFRWHIRLFYYVLKLFSFSFLQSFRTLFLGIIAILDRMEKLNLRSSRNQIKIMGTLVSIAGALTVTLYQGPQIGSPKIQSLSPSLNLSLQASKFILHLQGMVNNWVIGGLFLAIACFSVSVWTTAQVTLQELLHTIRRTYIFLEIRTELIKFCDRLEAAILKGYPSELTIVAFYCLFGSMQCAVVSSVAERNHPTAWKLRPDIELISIIYSAVFGSTITFGVQTWCIHTKGPVFVAMFKPLGIAIAAFMGVIFLGDTLHVGTVIGAVVIIIGFYGVMWAQSKESEEQGDDSLGSTSQKTPLLKNQGDV